MCWASVLNLFEQRAPWLRKLLNFSDLFSAVHPTADSVGAAGRGLEKEPRVLVAWTLHG